MFIAAISNPHLFVRLSNHPILSHFFVFRADRIPFLREPITAARIYALFRVKDGTSKETAPGRFRDLDEISVELIPTGAHFIHDVAVSSGITTAEFYAFLTKKNIDFTLYASDKFSKYFYKGWLVRKIFDQDKKYLHAYFLGILGDRKASWKYPVSKILFHFAKRLEYGDKPYFEIPLYDFRLMELINTQKVIDLTFDIFETPLPNKFTFIRCMNILNLSYFKPEMILAGIGLLKDSLKIGGILLVGRTRIDGTNTASFYQKRADLSLYLIRELNGGSEIKDLIV